MMITWGHVGCFFFYILVHMYFDRAKLIAEWKRLSRESDILEKFEKDKEEREKNKAP